MADPKLTAEVQMPATHGTLQSMKYLGSTFGGNEFIYNPASKDPITKLVHTATGPWRHDGNGNPRNMLEVVQSLLPDLHIVFVVERDLNRNVVLYCVNESTAGVINRENPMTVMWLMISKKADTTVTPNADTGDVDLGEVHTEDLNTLERTLAYGVSDVVVQSDDKLKVRVRAVNGEDILIRYDAAENAWEACICLQNRYLYLERFRIFTEPRTFAPWPKTVQLHVDGRLMTGNAITYHYEV